MFVKFMNKNLNKQILTDAYHALKSPLVSIKSLLFVLKKTSHNTTAFEEKINQIENKTDILHYRLETFLNYLQYKEKTVDFLYSFFDIIILIQRVIGDIEEVSKRNKILFKNNEKHIVMGDEGQLYEALRILLGQSASMSQTMQIEVVSEKKDIVIAVGLTKIEAQPMPVNRDEENIQKQRLFIGEQIIYLHGGKIRFDSQNSITSISIPKKAYARKNKITL